MHHQIDGYLSVVGTALKRLDPTDIEQIVDALFDAAVNRRRVYSFGNGASAALAAHMACDYGKGSAPDLGEGLSYSGAIRLKIVALNDNVALLTAYGNDICFDDIFLEQLKNHLNVGDVVIGISGSGGSPNVLRGMQYAREKGALTIGMTGMQRSALQLARLCDICLQAPVEIMEQIEDLHVIAHHAIAVSLRERVAAWHASSRAAAAD